MPLRTEPPYALVAVGRQRFWLHIPILGRMPLGRDVRKKGFQIILARDNDLSRTDRAAHTAGAGSNGGLPFMTLLTPPPSLTDRTGRDILWRQPSVFCRMPLFCKLGMGRDQVIKAGKNRPIGAVGAAAAIGPGFHNGLPFVALFADPPDCFVAPCGDHLRRPGTIQRRMPLFGDFRSLRSQVVKAEPYLLPGAIRTAIAILNPVVYSLLPRVAFIAYPPDLFAAPHCHHIRHQGAVFRWMPLPCDLGFL